MSSSACKRQLPRTSSDPALDLNGGQTVTIKAGQTTGYFRVGYDLFTYTRVIYVKFTITSGKSNGPGTYANIMPLRVVLYPSTSVGVKITSFTALAAGGRSKPLAFYLEKGPYKQLTVGVYQIGRVPDMMGIYPSQLVFAPGEKMKYFWLSTDIASKGSEGSVVFTLTGDTKEVYNFPNRQKDFYIYEGRSVSPVVLYKTIEGPTKENKLIVDLTTDTTCTVYFAVYPRGTLDVTFTEVRNKKLRYDNFQGSYKLGEHVDSNTLNRLYFEIPEIEPEQQQTLKLFVQNMDGVLADAIYYTFSTVTPEPPMKVYIQMSDNSTASSIITNIKSSITDGDRISTETPDANMFFEQLQIGEVAVNISYPSNELTEDLKNKRNAFIKSKVSSATDTLANSTSTANKTAANTIIAQTMSTNTSSQISGIGSATTFKNVNMQRVVLEPYIDLAMDYGVYQKKQQMRTIYTTKPVTPLLYGQEAGIQDP